MSGLETYGPPDIRGTTPETELTEPLEGGGQFYQPGDEGLREEPIPEGNIAEGEGPEQQGNIGGGEEFYADPVDFYGPYQPRPELAGPGDNAAIARSKAFHDGAIKALLDDNPALARSFNFEMDKELAISNTMVKAAGLPPETRAPNATYVNLDTEFERLAFIQLEKQAKLNDALKELDWEGSETFLRDGLKQYRERNSTRYAIDTTGMDEQQLLIHRQQMEPLVMDPMVIADERQKLAKIDAVMKELHPGNPEDPDDPPWSVFTHPQTSRIAQWIGREASLSTGFFQSEDGERGAPDSTLNEIAMASIEGMESFFNFPLELVYGTMELVGWAPPSNYIEGEDGKLYTNEGKVPGIVELIVAGYATVMGEDVARMIGQVNSARAWETRQTSDYQKVFRGSAQVFGLAGGFGKVAGGFMGKGQQLAVAAVTKGLGYLPQMGERGTKIITLLGGTFGAAAGQGFAEGLAYGRSSDFWTAFGDGAKMAPIILAIGAMGKGSERWLRQKKMPKRISMALSGAIEGAGFEALDDIQKIAAWDFIRDPNDSTLMRYAQAMIGFGMFKGMAKRSPVDVEFMTPQMVEGIRTARGVSRGAIAKKAAEVEEGLGTREMTREESDQAMRDEGIEPGKAPPVKIDLKADMERARRYDEAIEEEMAREEEMRGREEQERTAKPKKAKPAKPVEEPDFGNRKTKGIEKALEDVIAEGKRGRAADEFIEGEMRREEEMRGEEGYPETLGTKGGEGPRPRLVEGEPAERLFKGEGPSRPPREGEIFPPKESKLPTRPVGGEPPPPKGKEPGQEKTPPRSPDVPRTAEEHGRVLEEMRKEDEAEAAAARPPEDRLTELRRLRAEGPTAENRARMLYLLNQARGDVAEMGAEAATELARQRRAGVEGPEKAPVYETRRPGRKELLTTQKQIKRIAKKMGVPYEKLVRYGEALRAKDDFTKTSAERAAALQTAHELGKDLDISEISQDPVMSARLRQAQAAEDLRQADSPEAAKAAEGQREGQQVDKEFGERYGPDSLRRGANPYRQQEDPGEKMSKEEETMLSFIHEIMRGKQDKPGFRWGKRRFGAKKGSEVQIAMHAGHMGQQKALGLFRVFENLIQTEEGFDLVVNIHEWGHALQRQLHAQIGGGAFWESVAAWHKALPPQAKAEIPAILENYPGWKKLTKKEQGAEAFAEWIARDVLGESTITEIAPAFSREMSAFLAKHPRFINEGGQYYDLKKNLATWTDMGSRRRMSRTLRRAGLEMDPYDKREFQEFSDAVIKAMFDDKIELKKSQERWLKRSDISAEMLPITLDPSRMIDTLAMTASKEAQSFLKNGPHDLAWRKIHGVKSFEQVIADVVGEAKGLERNIRIIDFIDYIYGTRALEKFESAEMADPKRDFRMPLPKSDYVRGVADIIAQYPEFAGMSKALKAWSDSLVDLVAEAGNLSFDDVNRMKAEGTVYIPFVRTIEGTVSRFAPGRGAAEGGTGARAMKGGSRFELMDPVEAMEDVTRSMIVKARKNQVMGALYQLGLHADVGGLVTIIPKANVPKDYRMDQIVRGMQKDLHAEFDRREKKAKLDPAELGRLRESRQKMEEDYGVFAEMIEGQELSDALITLFAQKDLPIGEKDPVIAYTPRMSEAEIEALPNARARKAATQANNKMVWLKVDKPAFEALMSIDTPISMLSKDYKLVDALLRQPAQFLRFFATDANPTFTAANLIRDISSAAVFSRDGTFEPLGGLRRVIAGAAMQLRYGSYEWFQKSIEKLKKDPDPTRRAVYEMFTASGASTASFYNEGVRKAMRGEAITKLDKTRSALDGWTRIWTAPEGWIRLGEYERVLKRADKEGTDPLEAGYEALEAAKEITVNFARAGNAARWYNQMTPYFAAGLAGQRKLIRAVMGMEGKTDEERGTMQRMAIANGLVSITLPVLSAWWMVHDEDWYKDLPQWRKAHFLNFKLPGTDTIISAPLPFELGMMFGSIPMQLMDSLTDSNPNELLPMLGQALFPYFTNMSSWVPAAMKPTLEVATDKDFFRDRDITPFWTEMKRTPGEQMRGDTTKVAQGLWHALPLGENPIELEHWLGGHTGGFSTSVFRAIDEIAGLKDHPGMSAFTGIGPFINRFLRQTPHGASRTVDDLFRENKRLGQMRAKDRSSREKRLYTRTNRAKEAISVLRRKFDAGLIDKETFDLRQFEIANRIMDKVR